MNECLRRMLNIGFLGIISNLQIWWVPEDRGLNGVGLHTLDSESNYEAHTRKETS